VCSFAPLTPSTYVEFDPLKKEQTMVTPGRLAAILILAGACADRPPGSESPSTTLSTAAGEIQKQFSDIGSVAELPDDRAVVTDDKERLLYVADFKSGSVQQLGRQGSGPGEYGRFLKALLPVRGDTVWLVDGTNGRFAVITPKGELLDTAIPFTNGRQMFARSSDSAGRVYAPTAEEETAAVLRYDLAANRTDTVARLHVKQLAPPEVSSPAKAPDGSSVINVMITASVFQREDAWGAFPNGDVIVVRHSDYHPEVFTAAGRHIGGAPIPYTPIPFAGGDPDAYGEKTKPAFYSSVDDEPRVSPTGTFWLRRVTGKDTPQEFDVFDQTAKRIRHVVLPPSARLVALGRRYIYVVKETDDGTRLQRFAYTP
jgi:hypothetical protein